MLTRATPAIGMSKVVQMGAEVNCSKDHYLKKKGPLHGLWLPCGNKGPVLPDHLASRQNQKSWCFLM